MTTFLIVSAVWLGLITLFCIAWSYLHRPVPKPSPVKAVCPHCYHLHDGPMVLCPACSWACFPEGLVQEEVRERVDSIQYRMSDLE